MGFATVLTLDARLNDQVFAAWDIFEQASIGTTPRQLSEPPHVTFSISSVGSPDSFRQAFSEIPFTDNVIRLTPLGVFVGPTCVLYFNALLSSGLRKAHRDYHERLELLNLEFDPLYSPENILFHCTIAVGIPLQELPEAVRLASTLKETQPGHAVALELWEYFPARRIDRRVLSS